MTGGESWPQHRQFGNLTDGRAPFRLTFRLVAFDLQQGKDPTGNWKMCGGKAVKRVYEKNVKGYVYAISGGPGHKMQLPKDERRGRECRAMEKKTPPLSPSSACLLPAATPLLPFDCPGQGGEETRTNFFFSPNPLSRAR